LLTKIKKETTMSPNQKLPAHQQAINELRDELPFGPLDKDQQEFFDDSQMEIDVARAEREHDRAKRLQNIGESPVSHLVEVDGIAVPEDEIAKERAAGHDVAVHSTAGRQS
jgi:hypothetical protein